MTISTQKKAEAIHADLREQIASGKFSLGERLPTEPELAKIYKCSIGTVSKAVSLLVHEGMVERRTRTGTRVISTTGAISQSSVKLDAFAFIYPSAQHESTWRMMKGFQQAATEGGRRIVTLTTGTEYQREAEYITRLLEFDVCGAAISPLLSSPENYFHFGGILLKTSVPTVLIGTRLHGLNCPSVSFDAFHAAYLSTRHLLERGARKIGFLCNQAYVARNYFDGYIWALEESGIKPDPRWILREESIHPNFENPVDEPTELGLRLLKGSGAGIEAVVCTQDYLAFGVINAAKSLGLKVPEDLKVTGIDGLNFTTPEAVSLTSYHQPFEEAGRAAFKMLDALVSGAPNPEAEVLLRGHVVPGAST